MEELLAFMFTTVLGDRSADIQRIIVNGHTYDEAMIIITMSSDKFSNWKPILDRLWDMGFKWHRYPNVNIIHVMFLSGYVIDLARAMISVLSLILHDILDALNFEKWNEITRIAKIEMNWRGGGSQVIVASYKFTVNILKGTFELVRPVKDKAEADKVINTLKKYGYELHARINKHGKYLAVKISARFIERYSDIKAQVIEVLCRKLEKTKSERKRMEIIKAIIRLASTEEWPHTCPSYLRNSSLTISIQ
ncbi:hypothetical protein [Vulcanisaeta sp. JCM 16159]|uniref:hypothetical protein n=1 Tax=Vulcanisaeta sp. JCM 16159 TaxID=1295371 RepID=UPI0006CF46EE|nr:hypothetical protein [Vulcanisaeta sp. JCM 16159]